MLDFSDDYARSAAKNWYLDIPNSTVLAENLGIKIRELLTQRKQDVETHILLDRCSFFEELNDRIVMPLQLEFDARWHDC